MTDSLSGPVRREGVVLGVSRMDSRGRITIPKAVRQSLCVEEGDPIAFVEKDGDFVLRPIRQSLRGLRGSVPVSEPQDFDGIRESVKAARAERSSPAAPAESDAG